MSYKKAMKHARNPRKIKVSKQQRRGRRNDGRYMGFSLLAENERRETPLLGSPWFEPGREEERGKFIEEWKRETQRLLKENPDLIIVK